MSVRLNHKIIFVVMTLSLSAGALHACGPSFPNRVLLGGDNAVLKAPVASFQEEIERIKPPVPTRFEAVLPSGGHYLQQTAVADAEDLKQALTQEGVSERERTKIVTQYQAVREALLDYVMARSNWHFTEVKGSEDDRTPEPQFNLPAIPDGLPGEFEDYLRGAIFYHQGDRKKAIDVWYGLLMRPAQERVYRSTWAAFMIGKTLRIVQAHQGLAIDWFRYVRELAKEGFVDSLGLASSSLGWEANAALNLDQYDLSIELYVAQMATGDPTAITSLQEAACWALGKEKPDILAQVAENPTARRVITAYVISHGGPFHSNPWSKLTRKWLAAVEAANVDVVQDADRLAWAAYHVGEMELAERWVVLAGPDATIARWIRAKLLLRAGKVPEAADQLVHIARRFPVGKESGYGNFYNRAGMQLIEPITKTVRGELGVLHLRQRQYVEALSVLLAGEYWEDAAYVAERVLTADELKNYVDSTWSASESVGDRDAEEDDSEGQNSNWIHTRIRYLLARRLTRIWRWGEARPYYPAKWQERFDTYIQAVQKGENEYIPNWERAVALWKAACIARYKGMELLGTEVEPDWFVYNGNFETTPASKVRGQDGSAELVPSTADEQRRLQQNVVPGKRFHYRYTAVDYAWRAAELMPDNLDETARILCITGSWLKDRDPQAADRFYKTLVRRCGRTQLGKEADRLRWFPKIDIDKSGLLYEVK